MPNGVAKIAGLKSRDVSGHCPLIDQGEGEGEGGFSVPAGDGDVFSVGVDDGPHDVQTQTPAVPIP